MTDKLDGHLSRLAQQVDRTATVILTDTGAWILRRDGQPDLGLGAKADSGFGEAGDALRAWVRANQARG